MLDISILKADYRLSQVRTTGSRVPSLAVLVRF